MAVERIPVVHLNCRGQMIENEWLISIQKPFGWKTKMSGPEWETTSRRTNLSLIPIYQRDTLKNPGSINGGFFPVKNRYA
jgi:hypothetical protein